MDGIPFINAHLDPMSPYSPGMRASELREKLHTDRVVKISSNENPYGPFPAALAAGRAVLEFSNRYPDGAARDIRAKLAEHYSLNAKNIVVGNGSNELLVKIAQAILGPGDEAIYCWPSFIVYRMACQLTQASAVELPVTDTGAFDLSAISHAVTAHTKIIFLCNPNNPTGNIYRREEFEEFLATIPEDILICIDEAYFEYCTDASYPNGLDYFDGTRRIAVLRTFSKIYSLAGVRLGFAIVTPDLAQALNKVRDPFNVNSAAQAMAYYSLDDNSELERRVRENTIQRTRFENALDSMQIAHYPSHTNFVYAFFDDAQAVFEALIEHGIIVRPMGNSALRIGISTPEDTTYVIDIFCQLREQGRL